MMPLVSGQHYSPPSPLMDSYIIALFYIGVHAPLQPALTSPPPPRIPFIAVHSFSEWNAGRGRTGASRRRRVWVALAGLGDRFLRNETGHRFEKRVPVIRLPFYNLTSSNAKHGTRMLRNKITGGLLA